MFVISGWRCGVGAGNVSLGGVEFSPAALPCQIIPCTDLLPASLTSITQHSHQQTIENDSGTSNVDKSKQVANTQKHFCIPFNPSRLALTTHCAHCNVQCLTSPDPRPGLRVPRPRDPLLRTRSSASRLLVPNYYKIYNNYYIKTIDFHSHCG